MPDPTRAAHASNAPHRHAHRLIRWQRVALYSTGSLLMSTGAVWLAVHYGFGAGAGGLPHPLEVWLLRLHGLLAFAGTFVLGVLGAGHIPQGWRQTRRRHQDGQRSSGVALCAVAALLVFSGYGLFYFAPEAVRPSLGWAHAGIGAAMALLITTHRRGA